MRFFSDIYQLGRKNTIQGRVTEILYLLVSIRVVVAILRQGFRDRAVQQWICVPQYVLIRRAHYG